MATRQAAVMGPLDLDEVAWMPRGACRHAEPGALFPVTDTEQHAAAQRWCTGCPVRTECRDYALSRRIVDGVWGGLTETDRSELWAQLRRGADMDSALARVRDRRRRLTDNQAAVLAVARRHPGGVDAGVVAAAIGSTRQAARRWLVHLTAAGWMRRVDRGRYAAVEEFHTEHRGTGVRAGGGTA